LKRAVAVLSLSLLAFSNSWAYSLDEPLSVVQGESKTILKLGELMEKLPKQQFSVYDEAYHAEKNFEGFKLRDILKLSNVEIDQVSELTIVCADGYRAVMDINILKKYPDAVISYRQPGAEGDFDPIIEGKKVADPAPFYLVWPEKETYGVFPWPHQVVGIDVSFNEDKYAHLTPADTASETVQRGFKLFKGACLACHSINLTGGVIGPELNIPMNITEYREVEYLKKFIRNPDSFRARSRMTGLPDLTDQDIEDAIAYLGYMKDFKQLEKAE